MICPYNDGSIIHTREFEYDKVTGKIIKQVETVRSVPMKCIGDKCPFYDDYNYRINGCKRVAKDIEEDI